MTRAVYLRWAGDLAELLFSPAKSCLTATRSDPGRGDSRNGGPGRDRSKAEGTIQSSAPTGSVVPGGLMPHVLSRTSLEWGGSESLILNSPEPSRRPIVARYPLGYPVREHGAPHEAGLPERGYRYGLHSNTYIQMRTGG